LSHTFGSLASDHASIVQVQNWMGHADIKTLVRDLCHKSRAEDPARLPPVASRDPDDDYLLALAINRHAYLVTGDQDLIALSDDLPILTPAQFHAGIAVWARPRPNNIVSSATLLRAKQPRASALARGRPA
jgi:hypothetical protein